uniref:Uncharacterized protein n=1 Tax=Odontella aurita TaxID=265563 RepID=A0A7S4N703_9STRA|mmetsp:Transcript_50392/g.151766  ORF Transcript_50392/g.151766 Transcript_50392/m.151766 type:complete len:529 (+) Transcript_50392:411-1997(+)
MDVGNSTAQVLPPKDNAYDAVEETTTAAGEPSGPTSSYVPRSASLITPGSQEGSSPAGTPSPVKAASSPIRGVARSAADPSYLSTPSSTPSRVAGGDPSPRFALRFVSSSPTRGSSSQIDESPIVFDLVGVSPRATAPLTPSTVGVGSGRGEPMSSSRIESESDSELSGSGVAGSVQRGPIQTEGTAVAMEDLNLPALGLQGPSARNGSSGGMAHPPIRPNPQPALMETLHRPPRPGSFNRHQPAQPLRSASSIPTRHSTAQDPNLRQEMLPIAHIAESDSANMASAHHNRGKTPGSMEKMRSLPSLLNRPRSPKDERDHRSRVGDTEVSENSSALPNGAMHPRAGTVDYGEESSKRERRSLLGALRRPRSHNEADTPSGGEGLRPSSPLPHRFWQKIGGKDKTATEEALRVSLSSLDGDSVSSRSPDSGGPGVEYAQQTKKLSDQQLGTDSLSGISHHRFHQHRPLHDVDSHWPEEPQMLDLFHPPKITRVGVLSDSQPGVVNIRLSDPRSFLTTFWGEMLAPDTLS